MSPSQADVAEAARVLVAAQAADWAPIAVGGRLHDRGSYRLCWTLLAQARAAGVALPSEAAALFGVDPGTDR
jgi:citrate lyase subunit beta/citryl-CoA lyase